MPSPSPKIRARVRVFLCPEKDSDKKDIGQPWLCPAGVDVQLTRKGRGATRTTPIVLAVGELGEHGVTRPVALEEGQYEVKIPGPMFTGWDAAKLLVTSRPAAAEVIAVAEVVEVTAEADRDAVAAAEEIAGEQAVAEAEARKDAGELLDVKLAPQVGRRLVVVRLVTDGGEQVPDGTVTIAGPAETDTSENFQACSDGNIYAAARKGAVTLHFASAPVNGQLHCAQAAAVPYTVSTVTEVKPLEFIYWPAIQIVASPTILQPDGCRVPLTGTSVKVDYQVSPQDIAASRTKTLAPNAVNSDGSAAPISFEYPFPGYYTVTVTPPLTWQSLPIQPGPPPIHKQLSSSGSPWQVPADFAVVPTREITIQLQLPQNQQLTEDADFTISYQGGTVPVTVQAESGLGTATVPKDMSLTIGLAEGAVLKSADGPLELPAAVQATATGTTYIAPLPQHSVTIKAVDEADQTVPGAMIDIFGPDDPTSRLRTGTTDDHGTWVATLPRKGTYYLSEHYEGAQAGIRQAVDVASNGAATVRIRRSPAGGEALTDLSAYPVLTEEISTTGVPAPTAGAPGGGGPGAGYGQTVDQVMRDVLGWRPSGDVAGFQAALTGAFQLRQVEGHTEWAWQQRGYAVQADMGALTGAQASIYARAKAALDQIQPLLSGLTTLNPAKYEPQDLETIRSVVGTELQELVNELAWEGGPRIQRVDELFRLLIGEGRKSHSMDPDLVQGNLGTLRERFALTVDEIQTVDEERIVTNFRIIVEQVLALHASWNFDRKLLSGVGPKAALGTILIWLSRGLEAVCESVGDLLFALDSVYVDAAQRQVIELRFAGLKVDVPEVPFRENPPQTVTEHLTHQAPMFLSDLLDWVLRASRDEGPRIIQDSGKDGVLAFKPVLNTLRVLVRATAKIAREQNARNAMPAGMRTPRVDRAIKVLAAQLDEAANLASLVRVDLPPQIAFASILDPSNGKAVSMAALRELSQIEVAMTGSNFRGPAKAILMAEQNEDLPDLRAKVTINTPSAASAIFDNPVTDPVNAGTTWVVSIINNDETQSDPIEVLRIPR